MVCKSATFSFSPTKRPIQNRPKSIQNDTKRVLLIFSKSHGIRQLVSLFQGTHLGRRALPRTCPTPPGTRGRFAITLLSPSRSTNREPANWRRQPPTGVIFLGQFSRGSEAPEAPLAGGPGRPKLGPTYPRECGGALPQLFLPVFFPRPSPPQIHPNRGGRNPPTGVVFRGHFLGGRRSPEAPLAGASHSLRCLDARSPPDVRGWGCTDASAATNLTKPERRSFIRQLVSTVDVVHALRGLTIPSARSARHPRAPSRLPALPST